LDPLSQFALLATERARQIAALTRESWDVALEQDRAREQQGVVVGSAFGATATSVRYAKRLVKAGPAGTNPIDFPDSIDGAPAAHVALDLGLKGPSLTFVDGRESAVSAFVAAGRLVASGKAERMHVVVGDVLDEVFQRVVLSDGSSEPTDVVAAWVLERAGMRPAPAGTVILEGLSSSSDGLPSVPELAVDASPFAGQWDPAGVLELAGAWLKARGPMGSVEDPWQPEAMTCFEGGPDVVWISNMTYRNLSFRRLSARR
jgi:hypothetical protein